MLSSNRRLFHSGHEFINVPKWVDEKVLQKYFVERHSKYRFKGHDIFSARFNQPFDKYPDLSCLLDDHREVPAEVEWKTSDFNHDINLLKDNDGFLIVYKKDENFELEQIEVDKEDFDRWYSNTAKSLLDESIKELHGLFSGYGGLGCSWYGQNSQTDQQIQCSLLNLQLSRYAMIGHKTIKTTPAATGKTSN
jgi:hypothetical protein